MSNPKRVRADDDPKVEPLMLHLQNTRVSRRLAAAASAHSAMRRPLIGLAVGAALVASAAAGIVTAPAALAAGAPSQEAVAEAADAVQAGKLALVNAESLNNVIAASAVQPGSVVTAVEFAELKADVIELAKVQDLTAGRVAELTDDVAEGVAAVQSRTNSLRNALTTAREAKVAEDARLKAEAERIAAEQAAAKAAEEARLAAEALARVNTPEGAKAFARQMAAERYGWGEGEFSCLASLWTKESGWNYQAYNNNGGATGIPQALPGNKMAAAGADWQTNAATQISWGLDYIRSVYGSPCSAWGHSQAVNWY